mmetsp:Transcript_18692/g.56526  ORF Transcript_18692/g.56526 Transcript_18692/m.56526 type:complete len:88 (+) Transcript_18692:2245-2508(+)
MGSRPTVICALAPPFTLVPIPMLGNSMLPPLPFAPDRPSTATDWSSCFQLSFFIRTQINQTPSAIAAAAHTAPSTKPPTVEGAKPCR